MQDRERGRAFAKDLLQGRNVYSLLFVKAAENPSLGFELDETTIAENSELFDVHHLNVEYKLNQVRRNTEEDPTLYKCIVPHGPEHAVAIPSLSPTLWGRVANPAEEFPQWFEYSGVADAWKIGSKCTFEGEHYLCNQGDSNGNNVWAPNVFGWIKL